MKVRPSTLEPLATLADRPRGAWLTIPRLACALGALALLAPGALAAPPPTPAPAPAAKAAPPAAGSKFVLPPTTGPELSRRLAVSGKDPDELRLSVAIRGDKATVFGRRDGKVVMVVTLVHPSAAPPDAPRAAGMAVLSEPGPLDAAALAALVERLKSKEGDVPWQQIGAAPVKSDPKRDDQIHVKLDTAEYRIALGDVDGARKILGAIPKDVQTGTALRLAMLWRKADSDKDVRRVLESLPELGPGEALAAAAIRLEGNLDVEGVVKGATPAEACERVAAADVLAKLGRAEEALKLAQMLRERAPRCARAWESELHRLLEGGQGEAAAKQADEAVERFPDDDQLLSLAASVYNAQGRYRDAVPLLEAVSRRHPEKEGVVRVLLSSMLRDVEYREHYKGELEARLAKTPDDALTQFLLGIIHHYENRFEESNALLQPLEEAMGHQSRFHIYRAMNDFNLGDVDAAIARLDEAAERPLPDPDIFYCRAEILRDTNRQQAYEDLKRYRVNPEGTYLSNPDKEKRVTRMLKDLEDCLADGRPKCESEWEHPRLREHTDEAPADKPGPAPESSFWPEWLTYMLVGAGVALIGALILNWTRREPTS